MDIVATIREEPRDLVEGLITIFEPLAKNSTYPQSRLNPQAFKYGQYIRPSIVNAYFLP